MFMGHGTKFKSVVFYHCEIACTCMLQGDVNYCEKYYMIMFAKFMSDISLIEHRIHDSEDY